MRLFDTLFARVLAVQLLLGLAITVLFAVLALRQQAMELARATAPQWAAALRHGQAPPVTVEVSSTVTLRPGPPPDDAQSMPGNPRFRQLGEELRRLGVLVQALKISGQTGDTVTWLQLREGDTLRWVGVEGELEGLDARRRGLLGLGIGILALAAGAWWLSRRVLQPLAELQQAMSRFQADGRPPGPASPGAPLELRELSRQFDGLAHRRQALDAERRTMLAAISHDLRSPLGRIRMAAELLPPAEGVAPRREAIIRNVLVADRLLGSFIDLARAEDEPINGSVDLVALLAEHVGTDSDVAQLNLPTQPVVLKQASALALERALRNLLDNARLHGAPPLQVSLRVEGGHAVISVRDHGSGIAPDARAAMLQPFTRGQASRQTLGTGLGLAIAQRTAQRNGGRLELLDAAPGLRAELQLPL